MEAIQILRAEECAVVGDLVSTCSLPHSTFGASQFYSHFSQVYWDVAHSWASPRMKSAKRLGKVTCVLASYLEVQSGGGLWPGVSACMVLWMSFNGSLAYHFLCSYFYYFCPFPALFLSVSCIVLYFSYLFILFVLFILFILFIPFIPFSYIFIPFHTLSLIHI